jgi:hypothetical protein
MSEAVQLALISAIPPTLMGLATLIATLKGLGKLSREVNGHTERVMEAMKAAGKAEAKAETLTQLMTPPQTTVITDRRKEKE